MSASGPLHAEPAAILPTARSLVSCRSPLPGSSERKSPLLDQAAKRYLPRAHDQDSIDGGLAAVGIAIRSAAAHALIQGD